MRKRRQFPKQLSKHTPSWRTTHPSRRHAPAQHKSLCTQLSSNPLRRGARCERGYASTGAPDTCDAVSRAHHQLGTTPIAGLVLVLLHGHTSDSETVDSQREYGYRIIRKAQTSRPGVTGPVLTVPLHWRDLVLCGYDPDGDQG